MKTKQLGLLSIFSIALLGVACTSGTKNTEETSETPEVVESKITVTKAPDSPDFPLASLIKTGGPAITPTDSTFVVSFAFDVQNYELGVPTEDYETRGIANSGKGQHIHYIVNNGPSIPTADISIPPPNTATHHAIYIITGMIVPNRIADIVLLRS